MNHMCCGLEESKGRKEGGNEEQTGGIYSDAKCSIVECCFPVNVNCFVRYVLMKEIKYL